MHSYMRNYYFLLLILSVSFHVEAQKIEGNFQLDSTWRPVVYLSQLESVDDITMMSPTMIIAESKIDEKGNFSFGTDFFKEEDRLYRIHISKNADSPMSIIVAGKNKNHFSFIAHRNTQVYLSNDDAEHVFKNIQISGYPLNKSIREINSIVAYKDSTNVGGSTVKKEFIIEAIEEKLRVVADTSQNSLVSLYAMYKTDFRSNYPVNKDFYIDYIDKWEDEPSTYFTDFRMQIPYWKDQTSPWFFILMCILCFVSGFVLHFMLGKRKPKVSASPLKELSIQERKIFALLHEGKSNKEISTELNIGVSTVKSHVSNIYSKLNIKSRKEAVAMKLDL